MAGSAQRKLASIHVGDPQLFYDDTWQPVFAKLRREDPVHYCDESPYGPYSNLIRGLLSLPVRIVS